MVNTASETLTSLVAVCIAYIILDTLFVILRFVSRLFVKRSELGWDDYLIVPAYLFNIAACVCGLLIAHHEQTDRSATIPIIAPSQIVPILKNVYALILVLIPGFTFPKLSILTLYLRIFTGPRTRFLTWFVMALTLSTGIAYEVTTIIACRPIRAFWTVELEGQCIDLKFFYRSLSLPNIIIDVMILILPVPAVWSLQVSTARKAGLTAMFFTFVIALVATCVRWAVYARYDPTRVDPSFNAPGIYINTIEGSTVLIASCIPAMYPVLSLLTPAWLRAFLSNHIASTRRPSTTTNLIDTTRLPNKDATKSKTALTGVTGVRPSLTQAYAARSGHRLPRPRPTWTMGGKHANAASFARLVERPDAGAASGVAEHVVDPEGGVASTGVRRSELGLPGDGVQRGNQAKAAQILGEEGADGRDGGGGMPMEDLRSVGFGRFRRFGGEGIAVRTDITVTAEERIERLVGI